MAVAYPARIFNEQEVSSVPWAAMPSGTPYWAMDQYRVVSTDHTNPVSSIIVCRYCGTRHVLANLSVLQCAGCGAPL